jgi:asparaginyl-tRNA synthetase
MVEPEVAFYELEDVMVLAEDMLKYCLRYVLEHCTEDMNFFDQWIEKGLIAKLQDLLNSSFKRITYTEAVKILEKENSRFEKAVKWGDDLQSEHEKFLTEEIFKGPVIVTDYPKDIKAFYMKMNADGKTVRGMDVLVPRMGEIIGGSQREDDYDLLLARMEEMHIDPSDYSWYLDLRRYGSVPHGGFGLGLERFLQYITGIANIRDAIAFPRVPRGINF